MNDRSYIKERCVILGEALVKQRSTVRAIASIYGISKSTVHKDLTECLPRVDKDLYDQVNKILQINKSERHLRGGEATRRKYSEIRTH